MYRDLAADAASIVDDARRACAEIGLSARPSQETDGPPAGKFSFDRIRDLVKTRYSDAYDFCITETPRAGLWLACQTAFAESRFRRGSLPRCIAPRQKALEIAVSTLPPKYKHLYTPQQPSHPPGFDVVVVPLEGADYGNHGISNSPVSLLAAIDHEASVGSLAAAAEAHAPFLAGFYAQGASTPGAGFGPTDEDGVQLLYRGQSQLAAEFDMPYVVDETHGLPLIGEVAAEGSSLTVYGHAALGGLGFIVGTEDLVAPLLRADPPVPGEVELQALGDLLTRLVDDRDRYRRELSRLYEEVTASLGSLDPRLRQAIRLHKNQSALSVEVNYEDTWHEGIGLPIFTREDSKSGLNLLQECIEAAGIESASVLEASITVRLPRSRRGLVEPDEERARLEMKGLAKILQLLARRSGYLD